VSNIRVRLTFFFIAFPALMAMILFLPFRGHLVFNLVVTLASGAAAMEMANIFGNRGVRLSRTAAFILGAAGPLFSYLHISGVSAGDYLPVFSVLAAAGLLARDIFHPREEDFQEVLFRLAAYFFLLIYPGLFCSYVGRLFTLPSGTAALLVFVAGTYLNDSFAWASGVLWGSRSRNILTVSPNKSLVGFVFGFLASIAVVGLSAAWGILPLRAPAALVLGISLGTTTILGDLAESALKRSGTLKDSGNIIPGRGGFLDSIDSPLFSAPIFYYVYLAVSSGVG